MDNESHTSWLLTVGAAALLICAVCAIILAIAGCDPCPELPDAALAPDAAPTPPVTCGGQGDQCCVADIDGRAVLVCHGGMECLFPGEGWSDPDFHGVCDIGGAE